jgi:RHS repeat-associated protein
VSTCGLSLDPGGVGTATGSEGNGSIVIDPNTVWNLTDRTKYIYDGWNLIADLDDQDRPRRTYAWGLDMSGSEQGAGGVGGCVFLTPWTLTGTVAQRGPSLFGVYDGNGNATSWRFADTGTVAAGFEYGPFDETLTARGDWAGAVPLRFSTKYTDAETGLLYYGYRYYNPGTGRWISRDPIEEGDGPSLYAFVHNNASNAHDLYGLSDSPGQGNKKDYGRRPIDRGTASKAAADGCCKYLLTIKIFEAHLDIEHGQTPFINSFIGNGFRIGHVWIRLQDVDGGVIEEGGHTGEEGDDQTVPPKWRTYKSGLNKLRKKGSVRAHNGTHACWRTKLSVLYNYSVRAFQPGF